MNYPEEACSLFLGSEAKIENISRYIQKSRVSGFWGCCQYIKQTHYNVAFGSGNTKEEVEQYVLILEELFERPFILTVGFNKVDTNDVWIERNVHPEQLDYVISAKIPEKGKATLAIHTFVRALWTNNAFVEYLIKYWKKGEDNLPLIWLLSTKYNTMWRYGSPCYILSKPITQQEFKNNFNNTLSSIFRMFCLPYISPQETNVSRKIVSEELGIEL